MKKLLLTGLVLCWGCTTASITERSQDVVIDCGKMKQKDIYLKTVEWFALSPGSRILTKDAGLGSVTGTVVPTCTVVVSSVRVRSSAIFRIKDGEVKVTLVGQSYTFPTHPPRDIYSGETECMTSAFEQAINSYIAYLKR